MSEPDAYYYICDNCGDVVEDGEITEPPVPQSLRA